MSGSVKGARKTGGTYGQLVMPARPVPAVACQTHMAHTEQAGACFISSGLALFNARTGQNTQHIDVRTQRCTCAAIAYISVHELKPLRAHKQQAAFFSPYYCKTTPMHHVCLAHRQDRILFALHERVQQLQRCCSQTLDCLACANPPCAPLPDEVVEFHQKGSLLMWQSVRWGCQVANAVPASLLQALPICTDSLVLLASGACAKQSPGPGEQVLARTTVPAECNSKSMHQRHSVQHITGSARAAHTQMRTCQQRPSSCNLQHAQAE